MTVVLSKQVFIRAGSQCLMGVVCVLLLFGCSRRKYEDIISRAQQAEQNHSLDTATTLYAEALRLKPEDRELRLHLADLYFQNKQYIDAVPQYMALAKLVPENELVRQRADFLLIELEQYKLAEERLKTELKAHPASFWAREYWADLLAHRAQVKEAIAAYEQLLSDKSFAGAQRLEVRIKYGRTLFAAGQQDKALAEFDAVTKANPQLYDAQIYRANFYLAVGNRNAAASAYRELHLHFPKADEPVIGLAAISVAELKLDEAIKLYETARQLNPEHIDTLFWLAELYFLTKDETHLMGLGQKLLPNKPENEAILTYLRGLQKLLHEDYKGALVDFEKVFPFVRDYPGALDKLGRCYLQTGDAQRAETMFSRVEHDPKTQQELWLTLARAHLSNQAYARALKLLQAVNDPTIPPMIAEAEFGVADYREAFKAAQKWLSMEPGSIAANLIAAESAQRLDQGKVGREFLENIVKLSPDSKAGVYAKVQLFLADKNFPAAGEFLLKNYDLLKDMAGANEALGRIYLVQGKRDEAEKYLHIALKQDPNLANADALLGLLALDAGDKIAAHAAFDRTLKKNPNNTTALFGSGMLAYYAGNFDVAVDWLNQLPKTSANLANSKLIVAYCEFQLKHADKALAAAQQSWALSPTDVLSAYLTVRAQIWNGKLKEAADSLERCWKLNADYAPFYHAAAILSLIHNQPAEALQFVDKGLAKNKDNLMLRPLQVELQRRLRNYPAASEAAKRLTKDFPNEPTSYLVLGNVLLDQRQYEPAREAYRQALKLDPHNAAAQQRILDCYVLEKRLADAIPELENVLANDSENTALLFMLARLYASQNDMTHAISYYRATLKIDPRHVGSLNNLALLLGKDDGSLPEAVQLAERAFGRAGRVPEVMDTLGSLYLRNHDPKRAVTLLQGAQSLSPKSADILFHLTQAQYQAENYEDAVTLIAQMQTKFPSYEAAEIKAMSDAIAKLPPKK